MSNQLAAVSPSELVTAQMGVLEYAVERINFLNKELEEADENLERARRSKWATKPFATRVNALTRKIDYYKKVGEAVRKGYLIIPDVWASDVFAVRVKDKNKVRWENYGKAKLQKLPIGVGEYIDNKSEAEWDGYEDSKGNWHDYRKEQWASEDIDFPVSAVHPSVLEATEIAMADKIFDTMRIARQGRDPFIFGTIEHPTSYKTVTFFVAWFLDVSRL